MRQIVAGGAVVVGLAALIFSMAPDQILSSATASKRDTVRFTVDEGTNISITRPSDGESIIMDLHGFLYRIPGDGGRAMKITEVFQDVARPEISPNGERIAYQGYEGEQGGHFHVMLVNPDGSGVRQLTQGQYDHREPVWSRDGTRVAFSSDRPTGQLRPPLQDAALGSYNIWSADPNTGVLKLWADTIEEEEGEPTWSPDGTEIAYVVDDSIEAVNEAGERRTIIPATENLEINSPSWAPTGTDIAYIGTGDMEANLYVSGRQITTGQDVFRYSRPQWISENEIMYAADGKIRVIDINNPSAFSDVPFRATLEMPELKYDKKPYDFDTGKRQKAIGIVTPVLSPDAKSVVFQALNDLWIMEIGDSPRRLTDDTFYEVDPAWSRDGRYLAYSSDKAGTEDLYVRDMVENTERRITTLDGAEVSAAWSPDGQTIAFQNQNFETLTVNVDTGELRLVLPELFAPGKPSWSADGNTIALAARMRFSTRFREGHNQILTVDLNTGQQNYYPPGEEFDTITTRGNDGPVWSPDGTAMALILDGTLHVISVDATGKPTGPAVKLNNHASENISWSGDSSKLLYLNNGELKMISRNGGRRRNVELDLRYRHAEGEGRQIIHAGTFWDATSPRVRTNVDIEVVGNRIKSVRRHTRPLSGPNVIDASNLFVMPGLWDTHFHREREIRFFADRTNRAQLAYGMTSTMAPGDVAYSSVENRESIKAGVRVGPRGFASGEPIDGTRTHLDRFRPVRLEQLPLELSRMRKLDYDYVKTYVRTPAEVKERVARAAHRFGIPAGTHLMAPGFYVGIDNTTHLTGTQRLGYARTVTDPVGQSYEDVIGAYADRGIMTTIGGFDVLSDHVCPGTDPRLNIFANWKLPQCDEPPEPDPECVTEDCRHTRTMARMREAGSMVLAGTDFPLGSDVMLQLHAELRTLVFYGHWTPYRALLSAIRTPARFMGIREDLGSLEEGKLADIIFVEGNPLEDINDAINVKATMVNGIYRTVEEIIAPFPTTGNTNSPNVPNTASLNDGPRHTWLPRVPDHPANQAFWWHRPEFVKEDFDSRES